MPKKLIFAGKIQKQEELALSQVNVQINKLKLAYYAIKNAQIIIKGLDWIAIPNALLRVAGEMMDYSVGWYNMEEEPAIHGKHQMDLIVRVCVEDANRIMEKAIARSTELFIIQNVDLVITMQDVAFADQILLTVELMD
jgi:hypothetical protein